MYDVNINFLVVSESKVASIKSSLGVEVISAGQTDPDSDDTTRTLATKGLYEDFKKNLPSSIREIDSRRLMNDIRLGSGLQPIKEKINLVKDELREQYFRGEIFNVGDIVESEGQQYEIVKRGSNHLLLKEESGKLVSKWIQNVKTFKQFKEDLCAPDIDSEVSQLAHAANRLNPPSDTKGFATPKKKKVKPQSEEV